MPSAACWSPRVGHDSSGCGTTSRAATAPSVTLACPATVCAAGWGRRRVAPQHCVSSWRVGRVLRSRPARARAWPRKPYGRIGC
eukprot:11277262-Alexandrium_andersonii.AAC.1